jgi:hypothetical protein
MKKTLFSLLIFVCLGLFVINCAKAANLLNWDETLKKTAGMEGAGYVTEDVTGPEEMIAAVIQTALSFLGIVFLLLTIYGGYLWMTARGNEQQVEKAKNLLTAAIIGLIIVLAAYTISYFVMQKLGEGTLNQSSFYQSKTTLL